MKYRIHWKSTATGHSGHGATLDTYEEAQRNMRVAVNWAKEMKCPIVHWIEEVKDEPSAGKEE